MPSSLFLSLILLSQFLASFLLFCVCAVEASLGDFQGRCVLGPEAVESVGAAGGAASAAGAADVLGVGADMV